jgi:hypothetical protein
MACREQRGDGEASGPYLYRARSECFELSASNIPKRYLELIGQIREGGEPTGNAVDAMGILVEEVRQLALEI